MTNAVDALLPAVNDLRHAIRLSQSEIADLRDDRDSVARARVKILRSIEACTSALTDLKASLNSLTEIGRIPTEIIAHIMVCASRSSFDSIPAKASFSSSSKSDGQHPLHWIQLTHVCRTWRAAALNTPAFWGDLPYTRKDVFLKLLTRSKQAPLRVKATLPNYDTPTELRGASLAICRGSDRLREFHLYGRAPQILRFCKTIQLPMLVLHTLALTATDDDGDNLVDLWHLPSPPVSPSHLIPGLSQRRSTAQQQLPLLRHLELINIPIQWSDSIFQLRLTSLVIAKSSTGRSLFSGSPVGQLMDLLDSLAPSLENLELGNMACGQDNGSDLGRVVILPHLRSLTLSGATSDCATLFTHLRVPAHARIALDTREMAGIERLTRKLSDHYCPSSHTLREAHVHSSFRSVQVNAWTTDTTLTTAAPSFAAELSLTVTNSFASGSPVHATLAGKHTYLTSLRRLTMSGGAAGVDWEELLRRTPCLTSLTLDETPLADFHAALGAVWQLESGEYCAHVPDLARLALEGAHFRSPARANSSSLSGQGRECFDMMREWLARRASYGIPLEELHLKRCVRLHAKDVEVLRKHVSRVEWDGVVQYEEGEDDDETGKVEINFDLDGDFNEHDLCMGLGRSHPLSNVRSMSGGDVF
ncbi:hypothetical protein C8Q74DRAFT_1297055 [Fomes fomentarius]|nr:hypothetical protein C8Q74DRAFT_1297055 [Fomes fomentarius]